MGDWARRGDSSSGSHNLQSLVQSNVKGARDLQSLVESSTKGGQKLQSLVESSIRDGVEFEKCVVAQYTTTVEQKLGFEKHLSTCSNDRIPIDWVIDIADETNGWFYGTAYHFDDTTHMLHVMVPDKHNPSFDGNVVLDYRTVHLIECVDGKTDALFNNIIRNSVVRVKWDLDWFEEDSEVSTVDVSSPVGNWVPSAARYYFRIANQLLVEDDDFGQNDSRGFVMITADINVRFKECLKGKGQEDFDRLVVDGCVLSSSSVLDEAKSSIAGLSTGISLTAELSPEDGEVSVRSLADASRSLKECIAGVLDDRENTIQKQSKFSKLFKAFTMTGDLSLGLKMMSEDDDDLVYNDDGGTDAKEEDLLADRAWKLVQNLERISANLSSAGGGTYEHAAAELESLRKVQRKMKLEIDMKDKQLDDLYSLS